MAMSGLFLMSGMAIADHNDPVGSVGLLEHETAELEQVVRNSYLNYNVKSAVFQFSGASQQLVNCVRYEGRDLTQDHTGEVGCPSVCGRQLQNAQAAFRPVQRYLSDTQYDYPEVFQQFRQTGQALRSISMNGGGPIFPPAMVTCVAKDRGFEEHFRGHAASGRNAFEAQQNALRACQAYHGRCVIQSCN